MLPCQWRRRRICSCRVGWAGCRSPAGKENWFRFRKSVITFHTIGVVGYLQGPCCRSLQLVGVDRGDGSAPGCQVGGDGVHGSDGDGSYGGACGGGGGDLKWRLYLTFPTCS